MRKLFCTLSSLSKSKSINTFNPLKTHCSPLKVTTQFNDIYKTNETDTPTSVSSTNSKANQSSTYYKKEVNKHPTAFQTHCNASQCILSQSSCSISISLNGFDNGEYKNSNDCPFDVNEIITLDTILSSIISNVTNGVDIKELCISYWNTFYKGTFSIRFDSLFSKGDYVREYNKYLHIEQLCMMLSITISMNKDVMLQVSIILSSIFHLMQTNLILTSKLIIMKYSTDNDMIFAVANKDIDMDVYKEDDIFSIFRENNKRISTYIQTILDNFYLNNTNESKQQYITTFFVDAFHSPLNYTYMDIDSFLHSYIIDNKDSFVNVESTLAKTEENDYVVLYSSAPQYYLPPKKEKYKYTLVLDLDETLVHVKMFPDGKAKLTYRPGLFKFLSKMKKLYELVLFTGSLPEYCNKIMTCMERNEKYFEYKLYRQHCTKINEHYVKDLSKLGRELNSVIIVDNLSSSFISQPENGILIKDFNDGMSDGNILRDLGNILEKICIEETSDIRYSLRKYKEYIRRHITNGM